MMTTTPIIIFAHLNHLLINNLSLLGAKPHVMAGRVLGSHLSQSLGSAFTVIGLFAKDIELANATTDVHSDKPL